MAIFSVAKQPVLIAGGGIAGMVMALTFHQLGVPCLILESVNELKPLGVGINLQPNAVRELFELGIDQTQLNTIGVEVKEWALVGRNGKDIYAEPRGLTAGYHWPQYAVHRGKLQMLLYNEVCRRLGTDAVRLGNKVVSYRNNTGDSGVTTTIRRHDNHEYTLEGSLLIGADGIHSAIRAQMYPDQGPVSWGGAIMWRGTSLAKPIRTGASFIGLGSLNQRLVFYPVSAPDPQTGLATINWIAERTIDNNGDGYQSDWNKKVMPDAFIQHFEDWVFDWLDVPGLIGSASEIYEYPMVDRDPVAKWTDGRVVLMGDAAHAMYPVGSNGASQAIVDARELGAAILAGGQTRLALDTYNQKLCDPVSALVLRNRGAGPFGILGIVEERCGGHFNDINDVLPKSEVETFMAQYKSAAGFARDTLNNSPPIIPRQGSAV